MNKIIWGTLGVGVLNLLLVLSLLLGGGSGVGGTTNYDQLDTTEGYSVSSTSIINASGYFTGTMNGTLTTANLITGSAGIKITGGSLNWGGALSTGTSTEGTVLTAGNVCDYATITINPDVSTYTTTTLPTAASLIADCLGTVGMTRKIIVINGSSATTSAIKAAGTYATGTTAYYSSSSLMIAGERAEIEFKAISGTTVSAYVDVYR